MSYVDQPVSRGRTYAIIIVALLHALLAYAFVTGLAYRFVKGLNPDMKTFDVKEEPPPPPEEPPPPPPDQPETPPPVVAPPPIIRTAPVAPVIQTVREAPPVIITPQAPPAPPPPPPAKITKAQSAKGNLQGLFSADDYPQDALRNEETGRVTVRLSIGTNGKVTGCNVVSSSGSNSLDRTTCRVLTSRARFNPAKLSNGQATEDTYTQTIVWQLQ